MQKTILFFFFILFSLNAFTQVPFQKTYGLSIYPEEGRDIQKTFDGGYIIGGKAYRPQAADGNGDAYLLKLDYYGNVVWGKLYGTGGYNDFVEGIGQTADSGYIMAGTCKPAAQGKTSSFVLKTDKQGTQLWNKSFSKATAYVQVSCMDLTSDGGLILATYTLFGISPTPLCLIKMDAAGDTLWVKNFSSLDGIFCAAIKQTPDNGYIVSGSIYGSAFTNTFLLKTDASGNIQWFKPYSYGRPAINSSMNLTSDGGYVLAGNYNIAVLDTKMFYISKTDAAGNMLWTKTYSDSLDLEGREIIQTSDGGYLMNGNWRKGNSDTVDIYTLKTDGTGNVQWAKTNGDVQSDYGISVLEDNGNEYLTLGTYENPTGGYSDIYLVRRDENGSSGCNETTQFPVAQSRSVTIDTQTVYLLSDPYTIAIETYTNYFAIDNTTFCSTGIESLHHNRTMSIHPNPASQQIELELTGYDNVAYFIFGTEGKLLQQGNYKYGQKINIESLNPGFYTIHCDTEDYHYQQKLIVID